MIRFQGVCKAFGPNQVLRDLDLTVERGEILFIIGASGVGKSVTIKHLVGFLTPDSGEIWYDGQRIDGLSEAAFYPIRKRVGMVFQHSTLLDSMTLAENVALPLRKHRGLGQRAALAAADELLGRVQMSEHGGRYPAEVGDGMRKRTAIARALALEPEVVLFDEPTTGLDPVSARRVDRLIRELSGPSGGQPGVTSVVVSHDLTSILGVAHRVAFLYRGRVHCVGTPDELGQSSDPVVQQFMSGAASGPMDTPGF